MGIPQFRGTRALQEKLLLSARLVSAGDARGPSSSSALLSLQVLEGP